jgi:uncharacterized repeat protein (TIGR01451 family)
MKGRITFTLILLSVLLPTATVMHPVKTPEATRSCAIRHLPIPFVEQQGHEVSYIARSLGGNTAVTSDGRIVYTFADRTGEGCILKEEPVRAQGSGSVEGDGMLKARATVFHGREPKKTLRLFAGVSLGDITPGISLRLRASGSNVEKIYTVQPGSDPAMIRMKVEGGTPSVKENGELDVLTGKGSVRFTAPVAYQMDDSGRRQMVQVAYVAQGNVYGFRTGAYDASRELVIDPLLASTFLGGSGTGEIETAYDVAVDADGKVYVAGSTPSADFPVTDGSTEKGPADGFIVKFNSSLSEIEAAVFIGGNQTEYLTSLAVANGKVYAAGFSNSTDFPVTNGVYATTVTGGADLFVCILDDDLADLQAATYVGGSANEQYPDLAVSADGDVYVAMECYSSDFPMESPQGKSPYDSTYNASKNYFSDITIARLSADLTTLEASTYLGGSGSTYGYGYESSPRIALDASGDVWVAGITQATDFPTTNGAFRQSIPDGATFVFASRLDADLSTLVASTYVGPTHSSYRFAMAAHGGDVYVAGFANEDELASYPVTQGAYDTNNSSSLHKGFISRIKGDDLSELVASTLLGGNTGIGNYYPSTAICDITFDSSGNVLVTGTTQSSDFPTTAGAYDRAADGPSNFSYPFFISKLDENLETLLASTYLGNQYYGNYPYASLALDSDDNVYLSAMTATSSFPTTGGAYDTSFNSGQSEWDAIVAKLDSDLSAGSADLSLTLSTPSGTITTGSQITYTFTVTNNGPTAATGVALSHTLPAGVTFVSATAGQGTADHNAGVITCSLGDIAASGTVDVVIVVTAPAAAGSLDLTASASSAISDPDASNNASSSTLQVSAPVTPPVSSGGGGGGGSCFISTAKGAPSLSLAEVWMKRILPCLR